MKAEVMRKLQMAGSALRFCRVNPVDSDPGHAAVVARLAERLAHAEAMAQEECQGHHHASGATAHKDQLRGEIRESLLVLGGIARAASVQYPGLMSVCSIPPVRISELDLLVVARSNHRHATEHRAQLLEYALPALLLDQLADRIVRFESARRGKYRGVLPHVLASAALGSVAAEIMRLVRRLDALYRHFYAHDPERLRAWKSARNVKWPRHRSRGASTDLTDAA